MRLSGRDLDHVDNVKRYLSAQGMFHTEDSMTPEFTSNLTLDLNDVEPAMAGPKRPQDRVDLSAMKSHWAETLNAPIGHSGHGIDAEENDCTVEVTGSDGSTYQLKHGDIVISAITSCTNTSNPSVMLGAGILARNAVQKGLKVEELMEDL